MKKGTKFHAVIQGTVDADTKGGLTQEVVSKTIEFAFRSFLNIEPELKESLVQKLKSANLDVNANDESTNTAIDEIQKSLTPEESDALNVLRGRKMLRHEDIINVENFTKDSIGGLVAVLERGNLGLKKGEVQQVRKADLFSLGFLERDTPDVDKFLTEKKGAQPTESVANGVNHATNGASNGVSVSQVSNGKSTTGDTALSQLLHPVLGEGLSLDESSRHFLINTFHEAAEKLETPHDTMRRLADSVRSYAMHGEQSQPCSFSERLRHQC